MKCKLCLEEINFYEKRFYEPWGVCERCRRDKE